MPRGLHRVAVFIDWQNAYKAARRAFYMTAAGEKAVPNKRGNFSPYRLSLHLVAANERGDTGELIRVEIHRGLPASS